MANGAIHSKKTRLEIQSGADWVQVKGFKDFSGLSGGSASVIDVTDLDSDAKEKLIGLADEGQFQANFNFIDTDPGQIALEAARYAGDLTTFRLVLRSGKFYSFTGAVLSFEKSGGVDAVLAASATIEISGLITKGTVTEEG